MSINEYSFIPLPSHSREPLLRIRPAADTPVADTPNTPVADAPDGDFCRYPYDALQHLQCHLAPPYAVINSGPKCIADSPQKIALPLHKDLDERQALERRLELLLKIWNVILDSESDAHNWEQRKNGKRKRDEYEKLDGLSITRSQSRRSRGSQVSGFSESKTQCSKPQRHSGVV